MSNLVECFLEVYKDMVEVLLVLDIFLTVTSFKDLGSVITYEGYKPEIQGSTGNSSIDKAETSLE